MRRSASINIDRSKAPSPTGRQKHFRSRSFVNQTVSTAERRIWRCPENPKICELMLFNGALRSVSELFSLAVVNIWLLAARESLLTKLVGLAVPPGIRDWK